MIFVLSPAKALDYESPLNTSRFTEPDYLDEAACLIEGLRALSPAEVARLMDLSDSLAALNVARYAGWSQPFTPENARPAVLAFNGDVYDGLKARAFSEADLEYAQQHLRILSGLYGLLKPLDLMQPYRLEMGTRFANPRGKDLYAFWGMTQTDALNRLLASEIDAGREAVPVNLASEEYFKSVKTACLKGRLLNIAFEDWKGGRYKIISFHAKRARGMMARYAITGRIQEVEQIKMFSADGYAFAADASDDERWVFRRRQV